MIDYLVVLAILLLIADVTFAIGVYVYHNEMKARQEHGKPESIEYTLHARAQAPWVVYNDHERHLHLTDGSTLIYKEG